MENMKPNQKKKKTFPRNACAFYIKLYCKRRGSTKTKYKNKMVEAMKSWVSLSEPEKKQFYTKYKESEQNYEAYFFTQLKNAKLFMKAKDTSSECGNSSNGNVENKEPESTNAQVNDIPTEPTEHIEETIEQSKLHSEEINMEEPQELPQEDPFENEIESEDENNKQTYSTLIEPLAPTIKKGQELFYMLNGTDEDNITWNSLTKIEKCQYSRAVSIMKKDYLCKYKEYLESLTNVQIFNHYNKTIF